MVSRAVLPGINCLRSDSSLSASSTFTCWQALSHSLQRPRTDLHYPPAGRGLVGCKRTVPETVESWRKDFITQYDKTLVLKLSCVA